MAKEFRFAKPDTWGEPDAETVQVTDRYGKPPSNSPSTPATTVPWPSKRSPTGPVPATAPALSDPPPSPKRQGGTPRCTTRSGCR